MAKKNTYAALRERQQEAFNAFPCFFAFSKDQFAEGMAKLGVASEKELYQGIGGMFYRKSDAGKLHALMNRLDSEMKEAYKDDAFLYDAFYYELANHEYCITMDEEETLDALGIQREELCSDERMTGIFCKARRDYLDGAVC